MRSVRTGAVSALALAMVAVSSVIALSPGAAAAKTSPPVVDTGYVLGPSDVITVIVYGQQEFNIETRIKSDGSIVMPLIGKVMARGKTVLTLADEVESRLRKGNYLKDPIVNIEVRNYGSKYARVAGNVGRPGLFALDRPYTVMDALLSSGWVRGSETIILRSADDKITRINADALARGDVAADIYLQPGDTLYVPDGDLVFLTGQVGRPGPYQFKPGMTVRKLLAMAGGVGQGGSTGKFDLKTEAGDKDKVDEDYLLRPGDIINVRERLF